MPTQAPYDAIAKEYQSSKQLPFRKHVEQHSLWHWLGEIKDLHILDLACGEGIYARKLMQAGAGTVTGVDISAEMIALAVTKERESPCGILYRVGDANDLTHLDDFDLVLGSYLLNYARSPSELLNFCRSIYANLKPGGRFVGINDNPHNDPKDYGSYRPYGFVKVSQEARLEGDPITYTMFNPDGRAFHFDNYYLHPSTYVNAFAQAGFTRFAWLDLQVSDEGVQEFGMPYWKTFLQRPPMIGIEAYRPT